MNWRKIGKYAGGLLFAQFVIGFFEGFYFRPSVAALLGAAAASFVVCGAIFTHLAAHQPLRPFAHACAALLLQEAMGSAVWLLLALALPDWLGTLPGLRIILGWFVLGCALAAGITLGINLQQHRARPPADA